MLRSGLSLLAVAVGAALAPLTAQSVDTTLVTDSLEVPALSWITHLVPLTQDASKPFTLYLPWDEWAHSDLAATAANPFITADIQLGAARLDGSLGQPVLSAVVPSAVMEESSPSTTYRNGSSLHLGSRSAPDLLAFGIAPLQDPTRANQTYFFWDQGDYSYEDVQVGGVVQLDGTRDLMVAGQSRSHPGRYSLAGPSRSSNTGSVLQNYILDYQRKVQTSLELDYTLLHQREQTGLPLIGGSIVTADRRRSQTWAQGFRLHNVFDPWALRLQLASTVNELRTTTDGVAQAHLDRRSLSLWAGIDLERRINSNWYLEGNWQLKQRYIADDSLGYHDVGYSHSRLGTRRTGGSWLFYGGLAFIDDHFTPEGWLTANFGIGQVTLGTETAGFLDYPHNDRRTTLDSTAWLPGPVALRRTSLAFQSSGSWGYLSAQLAQLRTDDNRTAATGGAALEWVPWQEVLRVRGTITAVSSPDTALFPTRIYAAGGLILTLPLPNARARPFAGATVAFMSNDFTYWLDPRFANPTALVNYEGDSEAMVSWLNAEVGLKVNNFELRLQIYNATGVTIQNSPWYLPQPGVGNSRFMHYSLSWRFPPQQ